MTGKDKFDAAVKKLKHEVNTEIEQEVKIMNDVKNELATIAGDPELMKLYQASADAGAKNLSGELPLLKVYSVGKSKAEMADGTKPNDGAFFYKPTLKQFETVTCHILTISRGFRAAGMVNAKTGKADEPKFNQVMGGVILDEGKLLPFIMYFTGLKLQKLWEFGKEANKYTHMKPVPIPMFTMTVTLGTEKKESNYGESWIVNFTIHKNKEGFPDVITDPELFQYLRDNVVTMEDTIASLIETKSTEDKFGNPIEVESQEVKEV